jgi:uncharacterized protein
VRVHVPLRLRRAIAQNDPVLFKRILKNNPSYLQNPDFSDKSNTSLHLAAQHGCLDIAVSSIKPYVRTAPNNVQEYLISLGHDASGPTTSGLINWHSITTLDTSYNTDGDTPLHLAASHSHTDVVELLCSHFLSTINQANREGATPLHLASRAHSPPSTLMATNPVKIPSKPSEDSSTVEALLAHNADVHARDDKGNSCLHYASTWGNLKVVRVLIQAGADPLKRNDQGWTPQCYSITVQAEVYYKNLVAEWERRKAEEAIRMKERRGKGGGGLRLVKDEENDHGARPDGDEARLRAESMESVASSATGDELHVSLRRNDTWK